MGRSEGRAERVTHGLEDEPAVRPDDGSQQCVVPREFGGHHIRLPIPEPRGTLDVREQKGGFGDRKVGHMDLCRRGSQCKRRTASTFGSAERRSVPVTSRAAMYTILRRRPCLPKPPRCWFPGRRLTVLSM